MLEVRLYTAPEVIRSVKGIVFVLLHNSIVVAPHSDFAGVATLSVEGSEACDEDSKEAETTRHFNASSRLQ